MFPQGLKFPRQLRIAYLIGIKVHDRDAHTMLHFARTKLMQERAPSLVFLEVFSDMFGEKNVAGVTAIHHPLCRVDSSTREIGPFIYIYNPADWSAVNSHPKLKMLMVLMRAADFHCALSRRFRTRVKD